MRRINTLLSLLLLTSMIGMAQPPVIYTSARNGISILNKGEIINLSPKNIGGNLISYSVKQHSYNWRQNNCRPNIIALSIKLTNLIPTNLINPYDTLCPNHVVHTYIKPISPNSVSVEQLRTIAPNLKPHDSLVFGKKTKQDTGNKQ